MRNLFFFSKRNRKIERKHEESSRKGKIRKKEERKITEKKYLTFFQFLEVASNFIIKYAINILCDS